MYIDLSRYNRVTDWSQVAKSVEGVILRVGYRGYESGKIVLDSMFETYAKKCYDYNIPFGIYFMSQAITIAEAMEEADFALNYADKYNASLPIFIDSEDGDGTAKVVRADALSREDRTDVCEYFCRTVSQAKRKAGIYASTSWFKNQLNVNKLHNYILWVAQYGPKCTATHRINMWQYSSTGHVPGIQGNVDCSILYSFTNTEPPTLRKGDEGSFVKELQELLNKKDNAGLVVDGKFGNKTFEAVRNFQTKHKLVVDGIVGKRTREMLELV